MSRTLELRSVIVSLTVGLAACASQRAEGTVPQAAHGQAPRRGGDEVAAPAKRGHAPVNGLSMYYEVHGNAPGVPLVLLHGGGSTIDSTYGRVLPLFARHRTVIALEEQAHGRTTDRDGPVRFDTSAEDVATLLGVLEVPQADVMGFSNGASVALRLAIRHPTLVRRLVFASSLTKKSGARAGFWDFMAKATYADMPQSLKDAFLAVNPDPQKLRVMHDKDLDRMRNFVDTTDDEVRSVKAPTLVLLGDHDVLTLEHAAELTRLFPKARLLILPGGHGDYLGEVSSGPLVPGSPDVTVGLVAQFLNAPE
jgi:pimeloyl-ACP methyl ester carboxylesterase